MIFSRSRTLYLILSLSVVAFILYIVIYERPPVNCVIDSTHDSLIHSYQERGEGELVSQAQSVQGDDIQKARAPLARETTCTGECATNRARIASLQQSCANVNLSAYKNYLNTRRLQQYFLRTTSKSNLVYCDMPKIGSTFVKQVFAVLSGFSKSKDPLSVPDSKVHTLPFKNFLPLDLADTFDTLRKSFNFMIVREPYSRLLSAYVDKLYTTNPTFWKLVGVPAVRNARRGNTGRSCGHDVTFEEFMRYVISTERSGTYKSREPHWYPVYYACRPCHVRYDYIGKLETFTSDMKYILSVTNLSALVDISNMNRGNDMEAIDVTIERTFHDFKGCVSFEESLKRNWKVLQIRGVISHNSPIPKEILTSPKITQTKLKEVILQTRKKHPISKEEKRQFKTETLRKAFRTVSRSVLEEFKELYRLDFVLFGYDLNPDFIRNDHMKSESEWEPFS